MAVTKKVSLFFGILALLLFAATAGGQTVSFGIKIRRHMLETLQSQPASVGSYTLSSTRYAGAPAVEVGLPRGFAFSVEGSRDRLRYHREIVFESHSSFTRTTLEYDTAGHTWEFPFVMKKYVKTGPNVFVYPEGGISARRASGTTQLEQTFVMYICPVQPDLCAPRVTRSTLSELAHEWTAGIDMGGGLDFRAGRFHLGPEFRYTRWLNQAFQTTDKTVESNRNAFIIAFGLRFAAAHQ